MPPPLASAVTWPCVVAGCAGALASFGLVVAIELRPEFALPIMLIACGAPMWLIEYKRRPFPTSAAATHTPRGSRLEILSGAALVIALHSAFIKLQLTIGGPQTASVGIAAIMLALIAPIWLGWTLISPPTPKESPARLLHILNSLLKGKGLLKTDAQLLLGWCVKAFFLPLMLAWFYDWLDTLHTLGATGWMSVFLWGMAALYAVDTLFGTVGYLSTSRTIDAHIRSTDSTWLGWTAALACYPPLSLVVLQKWLNYSDGIEWTHWLGGSLIAFPWAAAILALTGIYAYATVVFGPRFSNLTNRGIITSGPFRWTKHPAYISKNLSWWLIAIPFVSDQDGASALGNCLALAGVNGIYWLRAKTEERHLMQDPAYREYANWIDQHGLWARLRQQLHIIHHDTR